MNIDFIVNIAKHSHLKKLDLSPQKIDTASIQIIKK